MKKNIQKPENWQDFETLCKRLWGEVWSIPTKIKKNGRSGQPQSGVDIYGIPKGESNYWGIQCKGKDDYANAKISKQEIDAEILKAHSFLPKLDVLIFATTMNKDVAIEQYVRVKDQESRNNNGFEILLFCWEDIADLIDENHDAYNFWVAGKQHKTKFDFAVHLNDFHSEFTIKPRCVRTIKRYRIKKFTDDRINFESTNKFINPLWSKAFSRYSLMSHGRVNEAICSFEIIMSNIGSVVLEDWQVKLTVLGEHTKILDQLGTGPMGMIDIRLLELKRTYVDKNRIFYSPKDNHPLIQKDNRFFKAHIIPLCKEYAIPIQWELLARDFNSTGILTLNVSPEYEDIYIFEDVENEDQILPDELIKIEAKTNYSPEE